MPRIPKDFSTAEVYENGDVVVFALSAPNPVARSNVYMMVGSNGAAGYAPEENKGVWGLYKGRFNKDGIYQVNDAVKHNGNIYVSLVRGNKNDIMNN